jgi:hypothetical protein
VKQSSSFLKKRTKKLLLLGGMGFGSANGRHCERGEAIHRFGNARILGRWQPHGSPGCDPDRH